MRSSAWLVPIRPLVDPLFRVICLPYAGGGAYVFKRWMSFVPEQIEVMAVELPGHGTRLGETPVRRLDDLIDGLLPELRASDRRCVLFGHSMGGLLAFELARRLRHDGFRQPLALFLSAIGAPHVRRWRGPVREMSDGELIAQLRGLQGTPEEVLACEELMGMLLPALRADFEILDDYRYWPELPLGCPITVFGGLADSVASEVRLRGWRAHSTAAFRLQMLPGGHFFIQGPAFAAVMQEELARLVREREWGGRRSRDASRWT